MVSSMAPFCSRSHALQVAYVFLTGKMPESRNYYLKCPTSNGKGKGGKMKVIILIKSCTTFRAPGAGGGWRSIWVLALDTLLVGAGEGREWRRHSPLTPVTFLTRITGPVLRCEPQLSNPCHHVVQELAFTCACLSLLLVENESWLSILSGSAFTLDPVTLCVLWDMLSALTPKSLVLSSSLHTCQLISTLRSIPLKHKTSTWQVLLFTFHLFLAPSLSLSFLQKIPDCDTSFCL